MDTMETKTENVFRLHFDDGCISTEITTLDDVADEGSSLVSVLVKLDKVAPFVARVYAGELVQEWTTYVTGRVVMSDARITFRRSQIVAVIA